MCIYPPPCLRARDGVWISSGTKVRNSILEFNFRQDFLTEVRGLNPDGSERTGSASPLFIGEDDPGILKPAPLPYGINGFGVKMLKTLGRSIIQWSDSGQTVFRSRPPSWAVRGAA